jgi:hypothetical protein
MKTDHRISKSVIIKKLKAAGLELRRDTDKGIWVVSDGKQFDSLKTIRRFYYKLWS